MYMLKRCTQGLHWGQLDYGGPALGGIPGSQRGLCRAKPLLGRDHFPRGYRGKASYVHVGLQQECKRIIQLNMDIYITLIMTNILG